ncbi:LicD family protein [Oribacterium parvum]|uniref:LicD family protein n=1 Tax=Oribacterium parvum TaxID=1501329 RepID=UPI0028DB1237|nr:LicD family protein [Oribacterium parvum]
MEFEKEFFYDEVRDGFYIPGIMKRLWAADLTVLSEVDKICKKYDIPYYAVGGTLLGAVRDGNFIPWDDDIDIMMFREDYKRFIQLAQAELAKGLSVHSMEVDRNRCDFVSVISKSGLGFHSEYLREYCEFPYSVQVDVFVLDELANNPEDEAYRQDVVKMFGEVLRGLYKKNGEASLQRELKSIEQLFRIELNRKEDLKGQVYRLMDRIFCEFNGEGGENVACIPWCVFQKETVYPQTAFDKAKKIPFCNMQIPIPGDYDAVLKAEYGEYRKKQRAGGAHNYPYFKRDKKALYNLIKGRWNWDYHISKSELEHPEVQNIRELAMLTLHSFIKSYRKLLEEQKKKDFLACLQRLSIMQEEAITFGNIIEKQKGEGTESVFLIEGYCEALYEVYQSISEQIAKDDFSKVPFSVRKGLKEKMKHVETCLDSLQYALTKDFKKQVVFLPHSAKHFESLRPLVDALLQDEEIDCKIIPIPYYDKCGDGRLKEMHYEGGNFPEKYEILDYNCYDFFADLPDCIIINSPYDEYNPVWTVDPKFYSREMKKYTKKLVYIPWFVTDEINPKSEEDGKAFINMEYYVTVPGVFHSDLTIVQSEGMKKAYLAKIEEFAGKAIKKKMEKKISGAGSCLLGEKEGQGSKEVVECFRRFLVKK